MVVCDSFHTSTTEETDVLIPSPSYLEQAGSFTRCDGTVQQSAKIITGPHNFENWQTIANIASLFIKGFEYKSSKEILSEIKTVNKYYKYSSTNNSWMTNYFNNGFKNQKLSFIKYGIDFSTFDPIKPVIHYPENYYISSVKKKLF
jgi:predicted molibdopterin-dependent oxidoreductase YjgC